MDITSKGKLKIKNTQKQHAVLTGPIPKYASLTVDSRKETPLKGRESWEACLLPPPIGVEYVFPPGSIPLFQKIKNWKKTNKAEQPGHGGKC